jgi:hypothetical protein
LRDIVGEDRLVVIDVDQSDSISAMLSLLKIDERELGTRPENLNKRLGQKKAALLYQFQFGIDGQHNDRTRRQTLRFAQSLDRMSELPGEVYNYHFIPFNEANRIQENMRAHIPEFLSSQLELASRALDTPHEAVAFENVPLTARDALAVIEVLIQSSLKKPKEDDTGSGTGIAD